MASPTATPFWVVIPAAGIGSRMQADRPKQYLTLAGRCIIEHTLDCFLQHPGLKGLVVSLTAADPYWPTLSCADDPRIQLAEGGVERADSVLNGLHALTGLGAAPDDWVLVHDAARCLLQPAWVEALLEACLQADLGGLLAIPVADTLKMAQAGAGQPRVAQTLERAHKWLAQTPQMFRIGDLQAALAAAGDSASDEASAMEAAGHSPLLLPGHTHNVKVTYPEDFQLAEAILSLRAQQTNKDELCKLP